MAAQGFKYLTEEDVQLYLPYVGSRSKVKKLYDKPEYTSAGAEAEQKYFIDGKWRTADWLKNWQKSIADGAWTLQQILQLQVDLGLGKKHRTGAYDKTTRSAHTEFLKENTRIRENTIDVNRYNYAKEQAEEASNVSYINVWDEKSQKYITQQTTPEVAEKYNAEQAAIEMTKQRQKERSSIQDDMFSTLKQLTGVTPTEANVNWATDKVLQGWGYDDFYFWMKDRPEMKKMYPGMPNGMLPSEYIEQRRRLNATYMENVGRPLSHEEIANIMKGGDFPDDGYFMGQPAIRDEEIR